MDLPKKWLIPVLSTVAAGIVVLMLIGLRHRSMRRSDPVSGADEEAGLTTPSPGGQSASGQTDQGMNSSYAAQARLLSAPWGRDLFSLDSIKTRSAGATAPPSGGLRTSEGRLLDIKLTGIVFFDNQYMALINDNGVREGDSIFGFKVLKIKRDYIVLLDGSGDYYTLDLK
ncbi:MAG: hypothetical protein ACMUIL_10215 [bacterium]